MTISTISDSYTRNLQTKQRMAEAKLNEISSDNSLDDSEKRAKKLTEQRDIDTYASKISNHELEETEDKKTEDDTTTESAQNAEELQTAISSGIDAADAYEMLNNARTGSDFKLEVSSKLRLMSQYDKVKGERNQDKLYGEDTDKKQEELEKLRKRVVFSLDGKDSKSQVQRFTVADQTGSQLSLAVG